MVEKNLNHTLCQHCYAWRCHPNDRFCGHCGENLLQAEVSIEPASSIYQNGEVPSQITTVIRNVRGGLGGTAFFWRNQAGTEIAIVNLGQDELNQPNEHEKYITESSDLGLESGVAVEWSLIHRVAPNKEYRSATLSCGLPVPVLALEKSEIKLPNPDDLQPLTLKLIHQSGGPAQVEDITVSAHEQATALNLPGIDKAVFPITLSQGEQYALTLPMTEDLLHVLQGRPQGLELLLAVQLKYVSFSVQLPLKLRVPMPARPVLKISDKIKALQGRCLRLPVCVENQGGESCRLTTVQVDIRRGREVIHTFTLQPPHPYILEAGKDYKQTLEIPLVNEKEQALAPKLYQCDVEQLVVEEQVANPQLTINLEIRTAQEYTGIVAIDLGTTATAVAILPQGNTKDSPIVIPLSDDDEFIPTAIAYYFDEQDQLQYRIGHDAIALLDNQEISDLVYLDNLKWQLDNTEPVLLPDGSERTWEDITVDYLKKIKEIIEEFTDIVAIVKQVVITQPSRFHPLLTRALNSAYHKADLKPLKVLLGDDKPHHSLAESWPSLTTTLPLLNLKNFQNDTVGYEVFGDEFIGKHAVLTYDVGGGSTDMSLFLFEIKNLAYMQITELGTDGTGLDDRFFGNGFSSLLFEHLWPSCELWLTRQGYDLKQFPITLPWEPLCQGADQKIARENGRRCAIFVLEHLQGDSGPFKEINLRLRNTNGWDVKIKDDKGQEKLNEELTNLIHEIQEEFDQTLKKSTLTLRSLHNTEVNIPGGEYSKGNGVSLDFEKFINDFIDTCSLPMFERLERLLHQKPSDLKIYLLLTGRGSFFPLVGSMLSAHQQRQSGGDKSSNIQEIVQVRVDHDFAKTIVSQGACYLAELLAMARGIVFIPRNLPSLGVQGDLDPDTGIPQFIPLCVGLPTPADGWQVAPYPLRTGGFQTINLSLYLSADKKKLLTDDDTLLGNISSEVNIPANNAADAHLMVKAEIEDCLEIYIGFPPEADSREYDKWNDKALLGHYEITPGACAKAREEQKLLPQFLPAEEEVPA